MMTRAQYTDTQLTTMLPMLDEVIMGKFGQYPDQWKRIFRQMTSSRSNEQTTGISGMGLFTTLNEGAAVSYDQPVQLFDKTYTHLDYAKGFKTSHQLIRDDKFGIIKRMATELGKSAKETRELAHAATFNNGFTAGATAGPDGVALFSLTHPQVYTGGTQSNILATAADFDDDSLRLILTLMRQMKDQTGKRVRIPPRALVVPSDLEFTAGEVLKSRDRSDTANRAVNALQYRDGFPAFTDFWCWDYLTDADAWFVVCAPEDSELRHYQREEPDTLHDVDFDTRSAKTAMWYAESFGWSDYLGLVGTPGA
ncbi:MAG: Mu-like prophage major head subunit gpT family protein [Planctomycetota bacterium]